MDGWVDVDVGAIDWVHKSVMVVSMSKCLPWMDGWVDVGAIDWVHKSVMVVSMSKCMKPGRVRFSGSALSLRLCSSESALPQLKWLHYYKPSVIEPITGVVFWLPSLIVVDKGLFTEEIPSGQVANIHALTFRGHRAHLQVQEKRREEERRGYKWREENML